MHQRFVNFGEHVLYMILKQNTETTVKGVITQSDCGMLTLILFSFETIAWPGHTGCIVSEQDPACLCGMTSMVYKSSSWNLFKNILFLNDS